MDVNEAQTFLRGVADDGQWSIHYVRVMKEWPLMCATCDCARVSGRGVILTVYCC